MGRFTLILLVAIATIGSWLFFEGVPSGSWWKTSNIRLVSDSASSPGSSPLLERVYLPDMFPRDPRFLRIATFNIQLLHRSKGENADILRHLAGITSQFDVVAIQGVSPDQSHVIGSVVDLINGSGRHYDYVVGPRVGRDSQEQLAYVFDRQRVDIDRHELYTIADPDDLLNVAPLVAWFRCRGPREAEAFTFTLVNVHTDPAERERENAILAGIVREVRNDRRGEDDVILLGDFGASAERIDGLTRFSDPLWAVTDIATDTRASGQFCNIVCNRQATDEATGRSGVFDFLREMNLSLDQAMQVSDHLPVWAEFSLMEGGRNSLAQLPVDSSSHDSR